MTTQDRRAALMGGSCPDCGAALWEVFDHDEHGVLVTYRCKNNLHTFGSVWNPEMGYVPVEEEES